MANLAGAITTTADRKPEPIPINPDRRRPTLLFRNFITRMLFAPSAAVLMQSPMRSNAYRGGRSLNQRQRRKRARQARSYWYG